MVRLTLKPRITCYPHVRISKLQKWMFFGMLILMAYVCFQSSNDGSWLAFQQKSPKTKINNQHQGTSTQKRQPIFRLILPHIEPRLSYQDRNLYVAVVVNTAASGDKHRTLRDAIRKTWGDSIGTPAKYAWKAFFCMGLASNQTDNEANQQEALEKNDVIVGRFEDIYINLVIKTFMSHFWAVTKLSCKYVLKTDDDVYVRVPRLISWLVKSGFQRSFYGGYVSPYIAVVRDPASRWFISKEQYNQTNWPPFCHGAFHVLSIDIIPRYLQFTHIKKPFHTDDAYIGVASKEMGINVTQIPGFHIDAKKDKTSSEMIASLALGHRLDSKTMKRYYDFYKSYNLSTTASPT